MPGNVNRVRVSIWIGIQYLATDERIGPMTTPRLDLRRGVVDPVVLVISRQDVEAGDVLPAVDRLHALLATPAAIWRYRGQMALAVNGYDDDPRELVDIAEVRTFLRELDRHWPYWAFFFNQLDGSISLLVACLCGSFYPGGGAVDIDREKVGHFVQRGLAAMKTLFDDHGFPEDELTAISNGVIDVLGRAGMA